MMNASKTTPRNDCPALRKCIFVRETDIVDDAVSGILLISHEGERPGGLLKAPAIISHHTSILSAAVRVA
jgi:hypothetical protein